MNILTGKPVEADKLRKIESIVNEQIEAELDVYSKEATLMDAKRINGLRAVFGEVCIELFHLFLYFKGHTVKYSCLDAGLP